METLTTLNREQGVTIIVVTHEADIAAYADRTVTMRDGRIISDERKRKTGGAVPAAAQATLGACPCAADGTAVSEPIGRHLGLRADGHGGGAAGDQPQQDALIADNAGRVHRRCGADRHGRGRTGRQ